MRLRFTTARLYTHMGDGCIHTHTHETREKKAKTEREEKRDRRIYTMHMGARDSTTTTENAIGVGTLIAGRRWAENPGVP